MPPPEPAKITTAGNSAKLTLVLYWNPLAVKRKDALTNFLLGAIVETGEDRSVSVRCQAPATARKGA